MNINQSEQISCSFFQTHFYIYEIPCIRLDFFIKKLDLIIMLL